MSRGGPVVRSLLSQGPLSQGPSPTQHESCQSTELSCHDDHLLVIFSQFEKSAVSTHALLQTITQLWGGNPITRNLPCSAHVFMAGIHLLPRQSSPGGCISRVTCCSLMATANGETPAESIRTGKIAQRSSESTSSNQVLVNSSALVSGTLW